MSDEVRFAYRENTARHSTPVGRVVLLYEQLVQDIGRAIAATQQQQVEARTQALDHALLVVGTLQGSLDLEHGGEVARNLDRFYGIVRHRLLAAHLQASAAILEEQRTLLLSMRAAWIEVEKAEESGAPSSHPQTAATSEPDRESANNHWRA